MTCSKCIYWLPRILGLCFVAFLSLFAFDVFETYSGWTLVLALLMHLLPSLVPLAIVLIAWRHELVGAVAFIGFAVLYVVLVGLDHDWSWYASVSLPAALVGILFLAGWWQKRRRLDTK